LHKILIVEDGLQIYRDLCRMSAASILFSRRPP
jgi:hypothetical protein